MSMQHLTMYRSASKENSRSMTSRGNPDISLVGLGSVGTVKKARKKIEQDAMLLANRIALLKQEELKAWRKIEEMKKKAQDIYFMKRRNEERQREKQINTVSHRGMMKDSQMFSAGMRAQQKQERQNILQAVYTQKKQDMMEIKKIKEHNSAKKKELKNIILRENIAKSQSVKEQEFMSQQRKQEFIDNKLKVLKHEKDKQLLHEEGIRRKRELEIFTMEKMELELVRKLEQTQQMQRAAFEELEIAMTQPADVYSNKFFGKVMYAGPGSQSARHMLPPVKLAPMKQEKSFDSDSNRSIDREDQLNLSKGSKDGQQEMTMRIEETNEEHNDNTQELEKPPRDTIETAIEKPRDTLIESVIEKQRASMIESTIERTESVEYLISQDDNPENNIKVVEEVVKQ